MGINFWTCLQFLTSHEFSLPILQPPWSVLFSVHNYPSSQLEETPLHGRWTTETQIFALKGRCSWCEDSSSTSLEALAI